MKQYRTTNVQKAYQSPRTTLEVHDVQIEHTDASVTSHRWDVIRVKDAVAILPINEKGNVLLLENYRYAVGERFLELCAGLIDEGETIEQAALRELQEETGFTALHLTKLGSFYTSPGLITEKIHLFEARDLGVGEQTTEPMEDLKVVEFTPAQIASLLSSGKVCDAKTLLALTCFTVNSTK